MSYLVLARKSRPQRFSEVIGQEPVVRTLQNALAQGRVPHALMFSGVRGTGKTTLARIMAKALNCAHGPAAEPCNQCRSCLEIAEGASVDLLEVDGASNRGIQEIRELKEKIRFLPVNARHKIILIDEVHMLTTEAFNALLKTLEEPPTHVYFMFATTEPHRVPVTILSRCQRYELKRLGYQQLTDHFTRLAKAENIAMEPEALAMIAREAEGSVRDGLSLLDQVFSYGGQKITAAEVTDVLGLISHSVVSDLGRALLRGDLETIFRLLDRMAANGTDARRFGNDLLRWFRGLLVCQVSQQPGELLDTTAEELATLRQVASENNLATVSTIFQLLVESVDQLAVSHQPRLTLELAFLRAVQVRDMVPVADLIARFDQMLAGAPLSLPTKAPSSLPASLDAPPLITSKTRPQSTSDQANSDARSIDSVAKTHPLARPIIPGDPTPPTTGSEQAPPPPSSPQPEPENTAHDASVAVPPAKPAEPGVNRRNVRRHWDSFLKYLQERQRWMAAALQVASSVQREGDTLVIHFNDPAECSLLKQRDHVKTLTELTLDFFQENLRLHFEVAGSNACDIDPVNSLAPHQERRALANDPLVLTALDVFAGQIGDVRIGPRHRTTLATVSVDDDGESSEE